MAVTRPGSISATCASEKGAIWEWRRISATLKSQQLKLALRCAGLKFMAKLGFLYYI